MSNSTNQTKPKLVKILSLVLEDKDRGIYRCEYTTQYHSQDTFLAFVRQKCIDRYSEKANGLVPEPNHYYCVFGDGEYINYITDVAKLDF